MLVLSCLVGLVAAAFAVFRLWPGLSARRTVAVRAARLRRDFGPRALDVARREADNPYNDDARTRFYKSVVQRLEQAPSRDRRTCYGRRARKC